MSVNSRCGSFCTFSVIILVVWYSYIKMEVLLLRKDVSTISAINEYHYSEDYKFSYKQGINVAVAFTAYDDETEWILDPSYGTLEYKTYWWGEQEDGTYGVGKDLKKTRHICTREELGLDDLKNARFMPIHPKSESFVEKYYRKMICIDKSELVVSGTFDSTAADLLNI